MMNPYPSPRRVVSSGGSTSGRVRKKYLRANDLPFIEITSSTSLMPADLLAEAQTVDPTLTMSQVGIEIVAIGGGGAGGSGVDAWGGLPGLIATGECWLSDLDATQAVYIDIGAGGVGVIADWGRDGNFASFFQSDANGKTTVSVSAAPGTGGTNDIDSQKYFWCYQTTIGLRAVDPTVYGQLANPYGPGLGAGSQDHSGAKNRGGAGNFSMPNGETPPGGSANPDDFLGVGGGGDGFSAGAGTSGGFPGGGGGASAPAYPGASGANSAVRYRYFVWEIVQ